MIFSLFDVFFNEKFIPAFFAILMALNKVNIVTYYDRPYYRSHTFHAINWNLKGCVQSIVSRFTIPSIHFQFNEMLEEIKYFEWLVFRN